MNFLRICEISMEFMRASQAVMPASRFASLLRLPGYLRGDLAKWYFEASLHLYTVLSQLFVPSLNEKIANTHRFRVKNFNDFLFAARYIATVESDEHDEACTELDEIRRYFA